jgi:hypothetical protein
MFIQPVDEDNIYVRLKGGDILHLRKELHSQVKSVRLF